MSKVVYSEEYQIKTIAYMLANPTFRDIARDAMEIEHLSNRALQWYFQTIAQAEIVLTPASLKEELMRAAEEGLISENDIDKVAGYYPFIVKPPLPEEQEHIQTTFGKFIRTQAMKQAILNSTDLIKNEQWDDVVSLIDEANRKGTDILTVGHNFFADFEQRLIDRINKDEARRLPTGIPALDELTYGGLKNKQLGLAVGGTGRGKSIFLEWLAKVAILLGKQVVYYTLELSQEDIAERFDSLFCHIKPMELRSLNANAYKSLHEYSTRFGNNLIIKEYPEGEASIFTLKSHYKQLASIGVTPDLIIVDYLDLMKPHRNYHDINQEQKSIVEALRGLSKSLNTRVWSALQLNRGGLTQDTPDESGVAGSISRIFTADIAIIMCQTKEEREDEIMRLFLTKNRNGPSPRTVKISTDFGHMTFYRPDEMMDKENAKELDKKQDSTQDSDGAELSNATLEEGALVLD